LYERDGGVNTQFPAASLKNKSASMYSRQIWNMFTRWIARTSLTSWNWIGLLIWPTMSSCNTMEAQRLATTGCSMDQDRELGSFMRVQVTFLPLLTGGRMEQ
jgi:hypothetical protein